MKGHLFFLVLISLALINCNKEYEGISITEITEGSLVGELLSNESNQASPIILFVPGSGSPMIHHKHLHGLVHEGYDVVSIAYHGKKGLPKRIAEVPIEYIHEWVQWIKSTFRDRKVIIISISKGAELSLVYASRYDEIDGLICYAPSAFVLPDHVKPESDENLVSSWSYRDEGVTFADIQPFSHPAGKVVYKEYIDPLLIDSSRSIKGRIPVEQISCPILLLSGEDDLVWPSSKMSDLIVAGVKSQPNYPFVKSISFENAGHQILYFGEGVPVRAPSVQSINLTGIKKHKFVFGGTEEGTIQAMIDSRDEVFRFTKRFHTP